MLSAYMKFQHVKYLKAKLLKLKQRWVAKIAWK